MKEKVLKITFCVAACICLLSFIMIRIRKAPSLVADKKVINYGDLGLHTMINDFLIPLPPYKKSDIEVVLRPYSSTEKHPEFSEAEMFVNGDSYSYYPRHITYPERLNDTLNKRVFFEETKNPYQVFIQNNYTKAEKKYLIYEIAERFVDTYFSTRISPEKFPLTIRKRGPSIRILDFNGAEYRYDKFFQINVLTHKLYSLIQTARFHLFGYISDITPLYSTDPPWLFFYKTVNDEKSSFYYKHSNAEIDTICNNILYVKEELLKRYNIEIIIMIVPSKITVYHDKFIEEEYNEFIPLIQNGLKNRNVKYIDLYHEFINAKEILYYPTDTHWNQNGLDIALDKTIQFLQTLEN